MSEDSASTTDVRKPKPSGGPRCPEQLGLLTIWCVAPERVGEVLLVDDGAHAVLGRGGERDDDDGKRLVPLRQRPSSSLAAAPIIGAALSRRQARIRVADGALLVENIGRCAMLDADRKAATSLVVRPGECFAFEDVIAFLCVRRPQRLAAARNLDPAAYPDFGEPDAGGIVGESAITWALRDHLAFLAGRRAPVLLLGPSGSGKELAARSTHAQSGRGSRRMIARNAATLPASLIEAELFGTAAHYPNHGMPERAGLVGEADGSTLFLDEIGDLPGELQTRLLRLLDDDGEYHRLGDARPRRANVRIIAATNRPLEGLRQDVLGRFKLRLQVPTLDERQEDIPLIARHLVRRIAAEDEDVRARFAPDGEPRFEGALMTRLVQHRYGANVRELESLLWSSIASSRGSALSLTREVRTELASRGPTPGSASSDEAERIREALSRAGGKQEVAWRELGLANRHALRRLMAKHRIRADGRTD